jgi:short-subunit dehydrogenase
LDPGAPRDQYALVTGACSGIGLEIARELARRGHPLVVVSHHEQRLAACGRTLAQEHDVPIHRVVMDLAKDGAAAALYDHVRGMGIDVEILVSNAGMFFFGEVAETDPDQADAMLHLHVVTPSLLALHFGRDMRARRHGHILLVSSVSAWRDFPGIAYYGSSKRYLRSFSAALRHELRMWGVNVTCLAPGAVATSLYSHTGVPVELAVKYRVMKDPAMVARAGVEGMFRGKAEVVPGMSAKLTAALMKSLPDWAVRLVRERTPLLTRPDD